MLLQLSLLAFAVYWMGSPWQLGGLKAFLACLFFILIIFLSSLPALFREWGNIKNALKVYIVIQIVCLVLSVVLPGIGQILAIVFNVYLMTRPVSFYKNIGFGFALFFIWFAGLNNLLGIFLLEDPRGVFSGNLYLTATSWVILVVFLAAITRTVYHTWINYKTVFLKPASASVNTNTGNSGIIENLLPKDSQTDNAALQKKERKTSIPFFLAAAAAIVISLFIQPSWKAIAVSDLKIAFNAIDNNDYETARTIAAKYYNDKKILYNGDVFYLNGLVIEIDSPQEAKIFYNKAASWYDNHSSLVNEMFHVQITEHVSRFEEQEKIGVFRRLWNNYRPRNRTFGSARINADY